MLGIRPSWSGSKPILSLGPIMWLLTDKQSQTRRKTRGAGNMKYNHAGHAKPKVELGDRCKVSIAVFKAICL